MGVCYAEADKGDPQKTQGPGYFAIVNGEQISLDQFYGAVHAGMKERFYHGNVPENAFKEFRQEVADELVSRALLLQEARRRAIQPDAEFVNTRLTKIEVGNKGNPEWAKKKDELLPGIKKTLQEDSQLKLLEEKVKAVSEPGVKEVREYYTAHPELFTTPQQDHVKIILLKVDPSSSGDVWRETEDKAAGIVKQLRKGADFSEMARIHSGDPSAEQGGDMGYIHQGMLGDIAQQVLNLMKPGDISEPVHLLEGIGIFLLVERSQPTLNSFTDVQSRAKGLLIRERKDSAWKNLKDGLKSKAKISVNNEVLK